MFIGRELTRRGDFRRAEASFREALSIGREIGDRWLTGCALGDSAALAEKQGDGASAQTFREESKAIFSELWGGVERAQAMLRSWDSLRTAEDLP